MPLKTRVLGAGKLLLLAGALFGTYVLFAAVSMRLALKTREVTVPDLTGRAVADASSTLTDLGMTLRIDETRRPDPKIAADRVVGQDPSPGALARRQRTVKVWVSSGPHVVKRPQLTGESERAAQFRLEQDGLTLQAVSELQSKSYPADTVVAQQPPPDSPASAVSLLVNRGERATAYLMPDLIGVDGERAAEMLRSRGFRVSVVGEHPYPGVPAGTVIRQVPQGGFQISPGEPISVEVSR